MAHGLLQILTLILAANSRKSACPREMNLQLHHVLSNITGQIGMQIIRVIVAGERDPAGGVGA